MYVISTDFLVAILPNKTLTKLFCAIPLDELQCGSSSIGKLYIEDKVCCKQHADTNYYVLYVVGHDFLVHDKHHPFHGQQRFSCNNSKLKLGKYWLKCRHSSTNYAVLHNTVLSLLYAQWVSGKAWVRVHTIYVVSTVVGEMLHLELAFNLT